MAEADLPSSAGASSLTPVPRGQAGFDGGLLGACISPGIDQAGLLLELLLHCWVGYLLLSLGRGLDTPSGRHASCHAVSPYYRATATTKIGSEDVVSGRKGLEHRERGGH